jgi:hypothetical protein
MSRDKVRPLEHKAQWWAEGANVHVKSTCQDKRLAGKSLPVANGRLIRCRFVACIGGCNDLSITVRALDPRAEEYQGRFFSDGLGEFQVSDEERKRRLAKGQVMKMKLKRGVVKPIAVCLSDLLRKPRNGYRWCGHKASDKECWCGSGFQHLKEGSW